MSALPKFSADADDIEALTELILTPAFLRDINTGDGRCSLARFMLHLWCAHRRALGGEYLDAQHFLGEAVDVLLRLLRRHQELNLAWSSDHDSPRRHLECHEPELARELLAILLGTVADPELCLLEICDQRLRRFAPGLCWPEYARLHDWLTSTSSRRARN